VERGGLGKEWDGAKQHEESGNPGNPGLTPRAGRLRDTSQCVNSVFASPASYYRPQGAARRSHTGRRRCKARKILRSDPKSYRPIGSSPLRTAARSDKANEEEDPLCRTGIDSCFTSNLELETSTTLSGLNFVPNRLPDQPRLTRRRNPHRNRPYHSSRDEDNQDPRRDNPVPPPRLNPLRLFGDL
jgi:hypothetical protein